MFNRETTFLAHYLLLRSMLVIIVGCTLNCLKNDLTRDLQNGGGVRRRGHFPPHKYIRNTHTCGKTPSEHLLNATRRPQTSPKARNSPRTWVGQKKKEKTETKE